MCGFGCEMARQTVHRKCASKRETKIADRRFDVRTCTKSRLLMACNVWNLVKFGLLNIATPSATGLPQLQLLSGSVNVNRASPSGDIALTRAQVSK